MPSKKDITDMKVLLAELKTDVVWLKRILIGAAGLGFLEKLIGWVVK